MQFDPFDNQCDALRAAFCICRNVFLKVALFKKKKNLFFFNKLHDFLIFLWRLRNSFVERLCDNSFVDRLRDFVCGEVALFHKHHGPTNGPTDRQLDV